MADKADPCAIPVASLIRFTVRRVEDEPRVFLFVNSAVKQQLYFDLVARATQCPGWLH